MTRHPERLGAAHEPAQRFVSYAQNFEDVLLWRALGHIVNGTYVDVGAHDPTVDSVSRAFHERGWRGVHVEPVAAYARDLAAARPGDVVLEAAVGTAVTSVPFFEVAGTGLSTTNESLADDHRRSGFEVRRVETSVLSLDRVLQAAPTGEIHWLKIDVEGAEHDVLASWSSGLRPWVVVVESTVPLSGARSDEAWEALLMARGYSFALFDGLNGFYVSDVHPELHAAFASGANVFDDFALSGESSEPFTLLLKDRLAKSDAAVHVLHDDVEDLRAAVKRLTAERHTADVALTEARRQISRVGVTAQAARRELESVYASSSWRVTVPLRATRSMLASGRLSPTRLVRGPMVRAMRFALARPAFKARIMRVLAEHPGFLVRLQRLGVRAGLAAQMGAFGAARQRTSSPHLSSGSLSPKSARVLDELITAIKERQA